MTIGCDFPFCPGDLTILCLHGKWKAKDCGILCWDSDQKWDIFLVQSSELEHEGVSTMGDGFFSMGPPLSA